MHLVFAFYVIAKSPQKAMHLLTAVQTRKRTCKYQDEVDTKDEKVFLI